MKSLTNSNGSSLKRARLQITAVLVLYLPVWIPYWVPIKFKTVQCESEEILTYLLTGFGTKNSYVILYNAFLGITTVILPLVITLFFTVFLVRFVVQKKKIRKEVLSSRNDLRSHSLDNVTKVLLTIGIAYLICLTPQALVFLLVFKLLTSDGCDHMAYFGVCADALALLNSSINFFIYYHFLPSFKTGLKKLIWPRKQGERTTSNGTCIETSNQTSQSTWM